MRIAPALALGLALSACSGGGSIVFVKRPWSSGQVALVIVANKDGTPMGTRPLVAKDAALEIHLEPGTEAQLFIRAFVSTSTRGPNFDLCGATLGGTGNPIPDADSAYASDLFVVRSDLEIALHPEQPRAPFDLRFENAACGTPPYPCDQVQVTEYQLPPEAGEVRSIAAVDDDTAFLGLQTSTTTETLFGHLHQGNVDLIRKAPYQKLGAIERIVFDGHGKIFASTCTNHVFSIDLSGNLVDPPRFINSPDPPRFSAGEDGLVLAYGKFGLVLLASTAGTSPHIPELGPIDLLAAARADRIIADSNFFFSVYHGGSAWNAERPIRGSTFEDWSDLAADDEIAVAVGKLGEITERTGGDMGSWADLKPPKNEPATNIHGVTALGQGRFFMVGDHGLAALWTKNDWCDRTLSTPGQFDGVSRAPSGRTAYAFGSHSVPLLVRFDLPN